jgi:folate-dependent phosphoribosylglycinamide formyltransferase PurN
MNAEKINVAGRSCRTVLICHDSEPLNRYALPRWMASFTDLAGIIVIREPKSRLWKRIKREIKRVGVWRFLDVLAMRLYSRVALASRDQRWREETLKALAARHTAVPSSTRILETGNPNSKESEQLLREVQPDIILARCKNLLNERIFSKAKIGTFVMHPGICPEYRNAHGCFWALAQRDMGKVGMTLLKIDKGVDTGPIYGYYSYDYDERGESHNVIQDRVVFDNLDVLRTKFGELMAGTAVPMDVTGRPSQAWGQPWLSAYLRWKRAARNGSKV